jgi:hypothetical protein
LFIARRGPFTACSRARLEHGGMADLLAVLGTVLFVAAMLAFIKLSERA